MPHDHHTARFDPSTFFCRQFMAQGPATMFSLLVTMQYPKGIKMMLATLLTLVAVDVGGQSQATTNLIIDGSHTFQTMGGVGTNINSWSWKNGELKQGLDLLIDTLGYNIFRVVHDRICWVSCSSPSRPDMVLTNLQNLDAATLQAIYETGDMQDLWNTIAYLNSKGVRGNQIMINFMGWTPVWMGGSAQYNIASTINPANNNDFAIMIASLVYYGKVLRGLDFSLVGPMNEEDWNGLEGPTVPPTQYADILAAIATSLRKMGITDVKIVAPDTASAPNKYNDAISDNSIANSAVEYFCEHNYSGIAVKVTQDFPAKDHWMTETSKWCNGCDYNQPPSENEWSFGKGTGDILLGDIINGFGAVLNWEGFDSFYYHHNSYSTWGSLACTQKGLNCTVSDTIGRTYTIRNRAYPQAILARSIRPGMVRVGVNSTPSDCTVASFYRRTTTEFSIVGHNKGTTSVRLNGLLKNVPSSINLLAEYQTNSTVHLQHTSDVTVHDGVFSTSIPADTFFYLKFVGGHEKLN